MDETLLYLYLAFLNDNQTEDQEHDATNCGEQTDQDALYDGLVEVTSRLQQMASKTGVVRLVTS